MRLSHVTLLVADIPRSRTFYETLGFELIVDTPLYCRFITEGDATLSIEKHEGVGAARAHIGFEFSSAAALDAKVAELEARGIVIAQAPQDQRWFWRDAHITDPDGHQLLLFYAGDMKLNPPWRVGREPGKS
jgi:catechol 2,3-dioxygenase-like lactoylglutathione lyase family enzyme